MTFYVDAWLDHPKPYVQVKNKNNQKIVARFEGEALFKALDYGDFCLNDFLDSGADAQMELVKSLLLLKCCEDIGNEIQAIYSETFQLNSRRTDMSKNDNVVVFPETNSRRAVFV